jgi:hypothetical protein
LSDKQPLASPLDLRPNKAAGEAGAAERGSRRGAAAGLIVCAVAVAIRLWLAWRAPASWDMKWFWARISADVERGARLYEDTAYHFSPLWAWLLFLFRRAPGWLEFDAALRTFLTGADIVSAWLLFRIARKEQLSGWAWKAPVLFLTNPVSIWVSSVQGQFDNLSLLFLLAAVLVTPEGEEWKPGTERRSGFLLSLSLAAKQVTLFHPLLWSRRRGGFSTVAIAFIVPALLFVPYAGQWRAILDRLLVYSSVPRSYGFSEFVLYDARWAPVIGAVDFVAAAAAALALGRERLPRACLLLFLVILFFAPGLGSQYLIWPITFGALFGGWRYFLFSAAAIAWTLGSHYGIRGSGQWMGHLIWLACGFWALGELRFLQHPGKLARFLGRDAG